MSNPLFLGDDSITGPLSDPIQVKDDPDLSDRDAADSQPQNEMDTDEPAPSSTQEAPPADSDLIASLPVYLSSSLMPSSSLHIFQYPIYPRERPLPVPFSAASRGLKVTSRWRPKANRVEVELPLDVREQVYNSEKGVDFGSGADMLAQKQAKADAAHAGTAAANRVKKEQEEERGRDKGGPKKLDKTKLDSNEVPNVTNYMVGVIRDQALHLTRLKSVVQLRPSMHYLDALDEAREAEKRRDRAAAAGQAASEDEDEEELIKMEAPEEGSTRNKISRKDEKKPAAQTLSVAVRGDPNAKKGPGMGMSMGPGTGSEARDHLMAAQREADAERWIDLEWRDEDSEQAEQVFNAQLFSSTKTRLDCKTKPREYLIEVQ